MSNWRSTYLARHLFATLCPFQRSRTTHEYIEAVIDLLFVLSHAGAVGMSQLSQHLLLSGPA
jgi:hypothetical protein